jgi:PAS domain S-box-containing protein
MSFSGILVSLAITVVVSTVLIIRLWEQRSSSGRAAMLLGSIMVAVIWWSISYALEIVSLSPALKNFFYGAKFLAVVSIPVLWLLFAFQYTGRTHWLTKRRIALFSIVPALTTVLIWTNQSHGLMWTYLGTIDYSDMTLVLSKTSIWFWVHSFYSYSLIMAASYFLFRYFAGSPSLYRRQLAALLMSVAAPFIASAITVFGDQPIDFTPFAFAITGLSLTWGLLRFQLLELVPIARNLVVESMTDGVIVLDAQGRVVDLNPAAKEIISQWIPDAIGKSIADIGSALGVKLDLARWTASTGAVQDELTISEAPNERVIDVQLSSLFNTKRELSGRVIIFRDITDRKQAEKQIRQQNEALKNANSELGEARKQAEHATLLKSQFLATMSHELRTPLNAVIGYSEIQLMGITGELTPKQREYQDRILSNALHLLGLINDILDLSKIEAGRMDIALNSFRLRPWLDEIVQQNRVLAEEKHLPITVEVEERLPDVMISDPERLKQVMINLLSNAVKFTEKGAIKILVARNDTQTWKIEVEDTGIGIPIHAQETVFEEFRQVDGSTRRQYGGTGLGLAIVRKLVVMMGGHIRLKSEVGKGSTFTVILPFMTETIGTSERNENVSMEVQAV